MPGARIRFPYSHARAYECLEAMRALSVVRARRFSGRNTPRDSRSSRTQRSPIAGGGHGMGGEMDVARPGLSRRDAYARRLTARARQPGAPPPVVARHAGIYFPFGSLVGDVLTRRAGEARPPHAAKLPGHQKCGPRAPPHASSYARTGDGLQLISDGRAAWGVWASLWPRIFPDSGPRNPRIATPRMAAGNRQPAPASPHGAALSARR